jgi:hypothetical protein
MSRRQAALRALRRAERALPVTALALLLLGRLMALPAAQAAAPEGSVPICMGGEIVLLALDGPAPAGEAPAEPCPWLGQTPPHALPQPAALPLPRAGTAERPPLPGRAAPVLPPSRVHGARAPPWSVRSA